MRQKLVDREESDRDVVEYDHSSGLAVPMVAVWVLFLLVFIDVLGGQISGPALPAYAKTFGVSNTAVGFLFSAFQLTGIIATPFFGRLSDKYGRRKVLIVSCLGAAIASIGQGLAPNYTTLFVMRAFGGIWGAVMPAARIYLSDVVAPGSIDVYMTYLSSVPGTAQTFGPGLGGGLAALRGYGFPLIVDGTLSFVIFLMACKYLPESPVWLQAASQGDTKRLRKRDEQTGTTETTPISRSVHILGVSGFFFSFGFFSSNSLLPLILRAKVGWDPLHVGYCLIAVALFRLVTSIWLVLPFQRFFGRAFATAIGSLLCGASLVLASFTVNGTAIIVLLGISRAGSAVRQATANNLVSRCSDKTNRGVVFTTVQTYMNIGRFVGPIIVAYVSEYDASVLPLIVCGGCLGASAIIDILSNPKQNVKEVTKNILKSVKATPSRKTQDISISGSSFSDVSPTTTPAVLMKEEGSKADYEELGKYVGKLLTDRSYKWVSEKEKVYDMFDKLLPPLYEGDPHETEWIQRWRQKVLHVTDRKVISEAWRA